MRSILLLATVVTVGLGCGADATKATAADSTGTSQRSDSGAAPPSGKIRLRFVAVKRCATPFGSQPH